LDGQGVLKTIKSQRNAISDWTEYTTTMRFDDDDSSQQQQQQQQQQRNDNKRERLVELAPAHGNRNLCWYMFDESTRWGMQAYIDYIFHHSYQFHYTRWMWSQAVPSVRIKTKTVCFEELNKYPAETAAADEIIHFFGLETTNVNTTRSVAKNRERRSLQEQQQQKQQPYSGGHATSKDPLTRQRLIEIIEELDKTVFNGEISWLASILPC